MDKPIVKITEEAWNKLWQYTMCVQGEISGLGHVYINSERDIESTDHSIIIEDLFILDQEGGGAHTKLKEAAIHKYLETEMRLALKEERRARPVNLWWHTHGNGGVFWSNTDTNTMDSMMNANWKVHIVANRSQQYICRVIAYKPARHDWDDVKIVPIRENNTIEIPEEIQKEVKAKVNCHIPSPIERAVGYLKGKKQLDMMDEVYGRIYDPATGELREKYTEGDKVNIKDKLSGDIASGIITRVSILKPKKYDVFIKSKNETHMGLSESEFLTDWQAREELDNEGWVMGEEELIGMVQELDMLMDAEDYSEAAEIADEIMEMDAAWGEAHGVDEVIAILAETEVDGRPKRDIKDKLTKASEKIREKLIEDEKEERDGINKS